MHQKLDDPHSFHALSSQQPFQLCSRSLGKSPGWRRNRPHQRMYPGSQEYEKILRLLPLHVWSAAIHLRAVSNLLERLGCHRHLRRADSMLRKHCSHRKTFALARWMQHEIIPYQRHISADGSKPRAEARAWANFRVKLIVSLAQKPVSLERKRAASAQRALLT